MQDHQDTNHQHFLSQVNAHRQVWGLRGHAGWAVTESADLDQTLVYPFWSDAADAARHCTGDWAGFAPEAIALDAFVDRWLPGMSEDQVLVGTNWDAELTGHEWDPMELAEQLRASSRGS